MPELYYDTRDNEWSVRYNGNDYSDIAAAQHNHPEVAELGAFAISLNTMEV